MNKKGSKSILSFCFTIMMVLLLAFPIRVFAQDETPATPTDPVATEQTVAPTDNADGTAVSTETTADPAAEVPEAPAGSLAGDTAVSGEPTLDTSTAPADGQVVVQEPVTEAGIVQETVQTMAESNLSMFDETGQVVPLTATLANDALASGDPWFDAGGGVIVGYSLTASCAPLVTECNQVTNPVQAAINDARSTGKDITIEGTYYEQITIKDKDVNLIGATTGGGLAAPGELTKNGEMDGTDLFGLVYISGGTVNLYGLTINGTGGYVNSPGNDIYAGVVFDNASGSVVTSKISNFVDGSESDQGVGICIYDSTNVTIEQNEISNNETGVLVNESEKVQIQNNVIHNISNDDEDTKTVGVDIQDSESIAVSNNDIHDIIAKDDDMKAYGVQIDDSEDISLYANIISNIFSHSDHDGYGVCINNSNGVSLSGNDIKNNDKGVLIDESNHYNTFNITLDNNNISLNDSYNLKKDIKGTISALNNFWGVDKWPSPGGWDGETVDNGHYELETETHCSGPIHNRTCHTHTANVWHPDLDYYEGFKKLAKLEGVSQNEIDPPLYVQPAALASWQDWDQDGTSTFDNCPWVANADQLDSDNDGIGNACDPTPFGPVNLDNGTPAATTINTVGLGFNPVVLSIPVTGGQRVELSCNVVNTLVLPNESKVIFSQVMCGFSAELSEETSGTLPAALPTGYVFGSGLTLNIFNGTQTVQTLVSGQITLQFPVPAGMEGKTFLILFWDAAANKYVEVPGVSVAGGLVQVSVDYPGTFILVTK